MSDTQSTGLLNYFAANAPADPPKWFKPDMEHLPFPQQLEKIDTGPFGQPGPEWSAWLKRKEEVEDRREEYRYFAWRWYYAEKMEATRVARKTERPAASEQTAELREVSRQLEGELEDALNEARNLPPG